jgi:hypothetical protein
MEAGSVGTLCNLARLLKQAGGRADSRIGRLVNAVLHLRDSGDRARKLQMVVVGIACGHAFLEHGDRLRGDEGEDGPYTGRHGGSVVGVRVRLPLKTKT